MHAEVVRHGATGENPRSDADVPAAEVCAVRSAALVVAGEVHAHGLVAGENEPEACADEECRDEECGDSVTEGEDKVSDDVQRHAGADEVNEVAAVDEAARHDAVQNEACGDKGVKPTRTADAEFLGVKGDVVGDRAVSETDKDEVCKLRDGSREEEPVERKRGVRFFLFAGNAQRLHENEADDAKDYGNRKDDGVAECFVKKHSGHGTGGEGEIHADAEVTDAFAAATCGQCIDGNGIACRARNAEEKPVGETYDGKNRQKSDDLVTDEADRECKERPEVERLAAERIDEETREGAAGERTDGVKRNDNARGCVVCLEFVDDIEREDWQQLVKAKEQEKVRGGDRHERACPKCRFLVSCCHNQIPHRKR